MATICAPTVIIVAVTKVTVTVKTAALVSVKAHVQQSQQVQQYRLQKEQLHTE
jgi:hypothetical protein